MPEPREKCGKFACYSRYSDGMNTEISHCNADVTFPEDFPNSVKHFLLIGAMGMLIGAGVILYLAMVRSKASVAHSVRKPPPNHIHIREHFFS